MGEVQQNSNTDRNTPSLEPFRVKMIVKVCGGCKCLRVRSSDCCFEQCNEPFSGSVKGGELLD